jgi:hypothetical protein
VMKKNNELLKAITPVMKKNNELLKAITPVIKVITGVFFLLLHAERTRGNSAKHIYLTHLVRYRVLGLRSTTQQFPTCIIR